MNERDTNSRRERLRSRLPSRRGLNAVALAIVLVASMVAMPIAFTGFDDTRGTAQAAEGDVEWEYDAGDDVGDMYDGITVDGDTLYAGSDDGTLHAVDRESGDEEWATDVGGEIDSTPTIHDDLVILGTEDSGQVKAYDAETGDEEWTYSTGDDVDSSPTVADGTVYVGSDDDDLHAVDAETGDEEWTYSTGDDVDSSPTVADGTVYVGSWDDDLHAVDAETGDEEWTYSTGDDVRSSPTVADGTVYVGSHDDNLHAVDAETGDEEWTYSTGDLVRSSPTVADGTVYVGSDDDDLHAVDAETGDEEWTYETGSDVESSPTVADGTVYVGSWDDDLHAVDAETGDEEWTYSTGGNVLGSPTVADGTVYVGSGDNNIYALDTGHSESSMDSRVTSGTLGYNSFAAGGGVDPITGQVVDQEGDPVSNATVSGWGIAESGLDEDADESLEEQAEELREDATDPLPDEYDSDYDLESHYQDANNDYVLVHEQDDWGLGTGIQQISSNVDDPRVQVDSDQEVVLSMWDPDDEPGLLGGNQVDNSFPGATTDGEIVVEQIGPTGEVLESETHETETIATTGNPIDQHDIPGVKTDLSAGVYRAYPEGHEERGYTFIVGSETELARTYEDELRDEAGELTDRAERIRELLDDETLVRETSEADESGEFEIEIDEDVTEADLKALQAGSADLEDIEDPDMGDLREIQEDGYNGTFYLPSPEPETAEPGEQDVTVNVLRSPSVPYGSMDRWSDLQSWVEDERLNETASELETEYEEQFEEMDRDRLESTYDSHVPIVETAPGAEDDYLDESEFDEIQDGEDLSRDELETETELMQEALTGIDRVDAPDLDDEEPITIEDGELSAEYPLPDGVDEDSVAPELHWSDGSSDAVDDEYWSVESDGLFGGDTLVIEDYPIDEDDPAAVDLRVQAAGDDGRLDDRVSATNPAFEGDLPAIDAVDFSTLAPGPDERVHTGIDPAEDSSYDELVDAQAFNDDGEELDTEVDESRDRASFRTDGEGVHHVRLTFEDSTGEQYSLSERVRAHEQSRSDPATIRTGSGTGTGSYAVTGEELESARIDGSGTTLEVDAIASDSSGPGELNVYPGSTNAQNLEVSVLHGSEEARVNAHIPVNVHLDRHPSEALHYRNGQAFAADGSDALGEIDRPSDEDEKAVIRSYTDEDGSLEMEINDDPDLLDRINHRLSRVLGDLPSVVGAVGVPNATLGLVVGFGLTRRVRR
ncbi:PQQ-binding-like beta-propeller repeat protein [Natrialbaceae archaeon GCM10025810]